MTKSRTLQMKVAKAFVAAILLLNVQMLSGQAFAPFDQSLRDTKTFVDTSLPVDKSVGMLPVGSEKWDLRYYKPVSGAVQKLDYRDRPISRLQKDKKTGKTIQYRSYTKPNVYYAILDLPNGNGRFYGVITCGYDNIKTILEKPQTEWHPYTKVQPVIGTIVKDGKETEYLIHSDEEWAAKKIAKPLGSYNVSNYRGYENVNINFVAGGTGTITLTPSVHTQNFITFKGGTLTKTMANGRKKSRMQIVRGGPHSWQITTKRPIKWAMSEDGTITITPTGAVTVINKDWVPALDDNTLWSSKADSIREQRATEEDHRLRHDEVIEYGKNLRESTKEAAEEFAPIELLSSKVTKKEIYGAVRSKDYPVIKDKWIYFGPKLEDEMDIAYIKELYDKADNLMVEANNKRDYGIDLLFNQFVDRVKVAVVREKTFFGAEPDYLVKNINPEEGSGEILYFKDGKRLSTKIQLDNKGALDKNLLSSALEEDTFISDNNAEIADLHQKIMAYKKDKRRGKVVKEYEKRYKNFVLPKSFSNSSEYYNIWNMQIDFIKYQRETYELLQ